MPPVGTSWNAGALVQVRQDRQGDATQVWRAAITKYMQDATEAACRGVYGTDEAFLCGPHSPMVCDEKDRTSELTTRDDVEVFETEHKWGGPLPKLPTKPRPCRFELSELDGGLTGAGDPSVERMLSRASSRVADDDRRASYARVHAEWTAPCTVSPVWWLPRVTRPHVR